MRISCRTQYPQVRASRSDLHTQRSTSIATRFSEQRQTCFTNATVLKMPPVSFFHNSTSLFAQGKSRFESKEGQKIPSVTVKSRINGQTKDVTTDQLFKGKKVIVFGLPGAFTPTCSSAHVPRYNELASVFKQCGADDIICVSVNDPFVMESWQKDQRADKINFIADGNGTFSEALGLLVDRTDLGFGKRSWRYSMFVDDGVIKKMFIENDEPGDPYKVSDAETMLKYLNPNAKLPPFTSIVTKPGCSYCTKAKKLLEEKGLPYEEIVIGQCGVSSGVLRGLANASTTPQVFINGKLIGGADQLEKYLNSEEFKKGQTVSAQK